MFYKSSLSFFLGVILTAVLNLDTYFVCLLFFVFILMVNIKDIDGKLKDINNLLGQCLLFMSFLFGMLYMNHRSLVEVTIVPSETPLVVIGRVASETTLGSQKIVSLDGVEVLTLDNKTITNNSKLVVNILVSPLMEFKLFDKVELVGELTMKSQGAFLMETQSKIEKNRMKHIVAKTYTVSNIKRIRILDSQLSSFETIVSVFKNFSETVKHRIDRHTKEPYGSIAKAISYGEKGDLEKEIKDIFIKSGLIHIMVLSGANVSFIIFLIFFLLSFLNLKTRILLGTFLSFIFVIGTGISEPSLRALLMTNVIITLEYFGLKIDHRKVIIFALLVSTIVNPINLVSSASLHLSFLAVTGLLIVYPNIKEKYLNRIGARNANFFDEIWLLFLSINLSITIYILFMTGNTNFFGVIGTVILEPLIWIITVLTFLCTGMSYLSPQISDLIGLVINLTSNLILVIANLIAKNIPQFYFNINENVLIIYYISFFWYFWKSKENDNIKKYER